MKNIILLLSLSFAIYAQAQFVGHSGVYYLGSANNPVTTSNYSNPNINGVVVRFSWDSIEPTPGNFNWTFVDGEIAKAITYNKKVSLQPLGHPHWLDSIGAQQYYYIDKNSNHLTYGQVISDVIPWDSTYVSRYKLFMENLSAKYANNPVVSYVNSVAVFFSRGLPDSVVTSTNPIVKQAFWVAFNYNADTFGKLMNKMTDHYMAIFPTTPLWCSVDYVAFEQKASGKAPNYLATIYCNYGIANYSNRFGLFREDLSGCNPQTNISAGSQWYIMQQNPCRTGAQMLWSVQDGPSRMNKCGILPNTKTVVLDSAVNKGLALGMRYIEVYGADIADASLSTSIQQANNKLIAKGLSCNPTIGLNAATAEKEFSIYPNPASEYLTINLGRNIKQKRQVQTFNSMGVLLKEYSLTQSGQLDISDLHKGLYFVRLKNDPQQTTKFIKQ